MGEKVRVDLELDQDVYDVLSDIARSADVSIDLAVTVLLATYAKRRWNRVIERDGDARYVTPDGGPA